MNLSVVIPLFNEADNVRGLYDGITAALEGTARQFEIVFVDDGSDDDTVSNLRVLAEADARVRAVRLRRNYGQTAAMCAGIEHAKGDVIVTMDGDLQNNPSDIPALVDKIDEGYDLVTGWRRDRKDPFFSRTFPSRIANWLIRRVTGVPINDTGCSLKAYRAELIRRVPLYAELHRFIPAMSTMATFRFAEVVVQHHRRQHGKSKYGLARVGRVILDVITVKMLLSSSRKPLHWFGMWAVAAFMLAALTGVWVIADYLAEAPSTFVPSVVGILLGYLAVHLLISGIFGDLVVGAEPAQRVEPLARLSQVNPAMDGGQAKP